MMDSWTTRIKEALDPVKGGGYYVLGRGHWLRGEYDRAAVALLWVPLVYNGDHQLAARSCLEAADALVECGRKMEAAVLYREVIDRYRNTDFARDAQATLKAGLKRARGAALAALARVGVRVEVARVHLLRRVVLGRRRGRG